MIKDDVQVYGIQPEMVLCHIEIKTIFERHGYSCVITSAIGKQHKKYSLHPVGYAKDYRTKHIKDSRFGSSRKQKIDALMNDLKTEVPQCDFVFEHEGQAQEHIHAEYDPKNDQKFQKNKELYRKTGTWPN
jgi:hypothetical protein